MRVVPLPSSQSGRMAALDSNDINIPAVVYAADKTLIFAVNATHLRTELYYRTVASAETGCFYEDSPGTIPAPDILSTGSYLGQVARVDSGSVTVCGWLCLTFDGAMVVVSAAGEVGQ